MCKCNHAFKLRFIYLFIYYKFVFFHFPFDFFYPVTVPRLERFGDENILSLYLYSVCMLSSSYISQPEPFPHVVNMVFDELFEIQTICKIVVN